MGKRQLIRSASALDFAADAYVYSSLFRGSGQHAGTHAAFSSRYLVAYGLFSLVGSG